MTHHRNALAAIGLTLALALAAPAAAQGVNPTASAVKEEQLLQALKPGEAVQGRISIPDAKAAPLIKPAGQEWRAFHQGTMLWVGAIAILGMLGVLALFYLVRGRITIDAGRSGIKILRFNGFERFTHWLTATSFIVLGLTGLNIAFGKYTILPLLGPEAFAATSQFGKYAHNYLAWPFMLGILFMLVVWVRDNIPEKADWAWIKTGGGLFQKGNHPEASRFNAGQKGIFWSVVLGGIALSVTGVLLLFPYLTGSYGNWQTAQMVHGLVSVVLVAIILGHIYIGSVGMEGAFDAMGSGEVDLNWAKEHHSRWAEEARAAQGVTKSSRPIPPSAVPAE
jgi:formate dehydrogenase subunit gamma